MPPKVKLLPQFDPSVNYSLFLIRNRLLNAIRKQATRFNGRLLDFGCGIKPYESLFSVAEYIGVDYAGEGETYTKEKADFLYDGKTLPFADNYFDGIFTTEVVEHIFNLESIVPELRRVLKPGGELLLTCPFAMPEHEVPADYARYTSFAVQDLFRRNGFEVVHYEKTGNFIEALFQLWIIWLDQGMLHRVRKIPVVRSAIRALVYCTLNPLALLFSRLFPRNKNLYLNNVLVLKNKKP
ncbi:class I SAM-dependent methyltransferase [Flaviaesturariibacter aridisoli]|uniref:Class I SAM-dependent methyltransferase n=1 Tax=Flaviaesturariibacter aridisoli TaxID=2545761 RepID=A0A4R4E6L0_9BACT|nr:class I SAM-dependent methyltransferase [Flaviaesturariibacter aridisoli]